MLDILYGSLALTLASILMSFFWEEPMGGTPQNINQTNSKMKAIYRFLIVEIMVVLLYCYDRAIDMHLSANGYISEFMVKILIPGLVHPIMLFSVLKIIF
jgi:hypothetical protein